MNGKLLLFSLFDVKADAFMRPWVAPTKAHAIRTFSDMCNGDDFVAKHPADFCLFQLGSMCEETGEISPEKVSLGTGVEFIAKADVESIRSLKAEGVA